jgi:hypothetical protein
VLEDASDGVVIFDNCLACEAALRSSLRAFYEHELIRTLDDSAGSVELHTARA